jgi:uncharacterized protein YdaU (DUF1376 family)
MVTRPWMPLYVADYLADTTHLSAAEHGAYLLLIMHYWANGKLPGDERKLARIARMSDKEWKESRDTIAEFFADDWTHARIERELSEVASRSDAARASAQKRWQKQKGQNADADAAAKPKQNECGDDAKEMRSHVRPQCSSQSQSQSQNHLPAQLPTAAPENEFDRVQSACCAALGVTAPADLVIGPMLEMFRKYGENHVIEALRSEARRPRRKPVKTWNLWATIVNEALSPTAQAPPPPSDPNDPLVELGGGRKRPISVLRGHLAAWTQNRRQNRWDEAQFGPPPDEPGCAVPNALLAEFGLQRVAYPVEGDAA